MAGTRFDNESAPPMFEPRAESMSADERASLQAERLRGLIGRLVAAGGPQGRRLDRGRSDQRG